MSSLTSISLWLKVTLGEPITKCEFVEIPPAVVALTLEFYIWGESVVLGYWVDRKLLEATMLPFSYLGDNTLDIIYLSLYALIDGISWEFLLSENIVGMAADEILCWY